MRMVVDANYFQDPALEEFLLSNPANRVVLTEMACMETYKGNAIKNLNRSLEVVVRHAKQVELLKPTPEIVRLQNSGPTSVEDWIDRNMTADFPEFWAQVCAAAAGDRTIAAGLEENGRYAKDHFEVMRRDSAFILAGVELTTGFLGPKIVRALRTSREPLPEDYAMKTYQLIALLALGLFATHPEKPEFPSDPSVLRDTLIFRYALAAHLLQERMIIDGGPKSVRLDRLGNDVSDMTYVAFATFFDGLLTRETKVMEIYEQARWLLDEVFIGGPSATVAKVDGT